MFASMSLTSVVAAAIDAVAISTNSAYPSESHFLPSVKGANMLIRSL